MEENHGALLHPIIGAGSLGLVCLCSLPAFRQLWIKARAAQRAPRGTDGAGEYEAVAQLFESADGQATAESVAAYSDLKPRLSAWASVLLGLAAAVVASVLQTIAIDDGTNPTTVFSSGISSEASPNQSLLTLDTWVDVPAWVLIALQCASIPNKYQYDRRFLLAQFAVWSSAALLASVGFRHGVDIVHNFSGQSPITDQGLAIGIGVCFLVEVIVAVAAFVSFAAFPHRPDVYYHGNIVDQQHAVSMLSRFSFSWNLQVFKIAHERQLQLEDLPTLDGDTRSSSVNAKYVGNGGSAGGERGRLWWQLIMAYKWPLFLQWVLTFIRSVLALFPQYVLYKFLEGLDKHHDGNKATNPQLWGWVISLGVSLLLQVIVSSIQRWLTTSRLEAPLGSLVQSLIFQKALRLDEAAEPSAKNEADDGEAGDAKGKKGKKTQDNKKDDGKKDGSKTKTKTSGDIRQSVINHMKLDSNRMMIFCTYNYWFPLAIYKLILAGGALARLLGWRAFLSGLGCALIVYPFSHFMSKKYSVLQFGLMRYRDVKSHVLTEALQGMRQIKYSALENLYEKKILDSRNEELGQFWRVTRWMCGLMLVVNTGPILLSCVSLAVYTFTTPTHVRASVIFASLGLFDQLDEAIGYLPLIQVYMMEAWTSCARVEKYLNQPDRPPVSIPGENIVFEDATVRWPRVEDGNTPKGQEEPVAAQLDAPLTQQPEAGSEAVPEEGTRSMLRNINLSFPNGQLSLVTGNTGSGKSLLLASILGEVKLLSGIVKVPEAPPVSIIESDTINDENWILPGLTAFVSQTPWVESGTLRDNILFGVPFREARYRKVLQACALGKDIELLQDGDETEVGPKGVTLSGGQRWRVALARALYSRAGILIMDDVLSAVDAHVGRIIVNQALGGELAKGRTRILATHHHEMCLAHATYLVKLESGRMKYVEHIKHTDTEGGSLSAPTDGAQEPETEADEDTPVDEEEEAAAAKRRADRKKKDEEVRESGRVSSKVYRDYIKSSNSYALWIMIGILLLITRFTSVTTTWSLKELAGSYSEDNDTLASYKFVTQASQPEMYWHASSFSSQQSQTAISSQDDSDYRRSVVFWLSAYVIFDFSALLLGSGQMLLIIFTGIRASRTLFEKMTHSILHAPLRWADTIPTGRILNRFTSDTFIVDRRLANDLSTFLTGAISLIVIIGASVSVSPYIVIFGFVLLVLYGRIAFLYMAAAREVKRINSVSHSPVYDQFSSVLTGLSTIRAFHRADFYMNRMYGLIDNGAKASWALQLLVRWMNFRMGMFGAVFVTAVAICIIFGDASASLAGFGLVFALRYSAALTRLLANITSIELDFNAAERIMEYIAIDTEPEDGENVPAAWPSQGHIEVEKLTVSYAPELPPVLKELNFEVKPGERIGVVGRTGAGKSTLAAVFFRLLEPLEGSVRIDGIDIASLKLAQLRSRLAIIPQDPFLFAGTLRSNIDLDGSMDDDDLREVLKRVHLVDPNDNDEARRPTVNRRRRIRNVEASDEENLEIAEEAAEEAALLLEPSGADPIAEGDIANPPVVSDVSTEVDSAVLGEDSGGSVTNVESGNESESADDNDGHSKAFKNLEMVISSGGSNLSQGQRQLVCLARALLTRPKIVVLDEATSAVDRGTDSAIQESLRREFASGGCTVLVIAHRLSTVVDFDRLLVLSEGRVAEMGTPKELMERGIALDKENEAKAGNSEEVVKGQVSSEGQGKATAADGTGVFWELVKRSAEKDKLLEMVFGEKSPL